MSNLRRAYSRGNASDSATSMETDNATDSATVNIIDIVTDNATVNANGNADENATDINNVNATDINTDNANATMPMTLPLTLTLNTPLTKPLTASLKSTEKLQASAISAHSFLWFSMFTDRIKAFSLALLPHPFNHKSKLPEQQLKLVSHKG